MQYKNILKKLKRKINFLIINNDNKEVIYNGINQFIYPKNKSINIRNHYIRELIGDGKI